MKYRFIEEQREHHGVLDLCRCLGVSASAYYHWSKAEPSLRRQQDEAIKPVILEVHQKARGRYGHRPVYHHLRDDAIVCGRDRTLRLMKELGSKTSRKSASSHRAARRLRLVVTPSSSESWESPLAVAKSGLPIRTICPRRRAGCTWRR